MNLRFFTLFLFLLVATSPLYNCSKSEDAIPQNIEVQNFVWKGMNAYYLWQEEKPDLADTRFSSQNQLNSYLTSYANPADLFQNLLYQPGVTDKFSWIVDDYIALENSFQGINETNGMEFGLVRYADTPSNVFGYVRYVVPGSDAAIQGITRGMIFNQINGTQIDENNYQSLIKNANYTISLADFNNGNPSSNGNSITLTASQITENPIFVSKVLTEGSEKIGYLMYNQFSTPFDDDLNAVFGNFKSEGINNLIIDLRYNGGGSVRTATYLAGMITGQFTGQVFSKQRWNQKVMDAINADNFINKFTDQINNGQAKETINSLNLTKVYFIVSKRTASASELIINSLNPYIETFVVGDQTTGKNYGSITLYDSDDLTRNGANLNPNHTWAMQPLVLEIVNKNDIGNPNGITPNIVLAEDYSNLGVLGETSDPLLKRTITYITTGAKPNLSRKELQSFDEIGSSKMNSPIQNNMYFELK